MVKRTIALKIACGQLPAIQSRIKKQMQSHQELALLSLEMFLELSRLKQSSPLIKRWQEIIKDLI